MSTESHQTRVAMDFVCAATRAVSEKAKRYLLQAIGIVLYKFRQPIGLNYIVHQ